MAEEDVPRTAEVVAKRCLVLYAVVAAGNREDRGLLADWLRREGVWEAVSPLEEAFLTGPEPERQAMIDATWRTEGLGVLLWALGKMEPAGIGKVPVMRAALPLLRGPVGDFVSAASLRAEGEILEMYEAVYQAHWEVRDARLHGRPLPDGLHPGEVYERHYALNWLIGYCGQEWDDVATDT